MDKNTVIGIALIALLWLAMVYYNQTQKLKELQQQPKTGTEQVDSGDTSSPVNAASTEAVNESDPEGAAMMASDTEVDTLSDVRKIVQFGDFAPFMEGTEEEVVIENEDARYYFSTKGGFLQKVVLKHYTKYDGSPLILFNNQHSESTFGIEFTARNASQTIRTSDMYFQYQTGHGDFGNQDIRFILIMGEYKYVEFSYSIPTSGYLFDMNMKLRGLENVVSSNYLVMNWAQAYPREELNPKDEQMNSTVFYRFSDGDIGNINMRKEGEETLKTSVNWVSFKQKFFNSTLIAENNFSEDGKVSTRKPDITEQDSVIKFASADMIIDYERSDNFVFPLQVYMGPNQYRTLKKMDLGLQNIIPLGKFIFGWVNKGLIIPVFNFLNKFIGNFGVIILILTILIKIVIFPFTYKSYLSMLKMKVLKPELDELREKYGKDQQKFGQMQMELFRKAGVNPLGGCLPMLFQMPILIAMYRFFPASIELRQESFLWAHDLSTYDSIAQLPFVIPGYGDHVSLFTILMAITSFFYSRMNSQATDTSGPMGAQMKMFQYIMPFMLLFIFNKFSAGLSYYYFLFNLLSLIQQFFIKKFIIDEDKIHAQIQENKKKPVKKSKFQARLEQMMKDQQEMQKKKGRGKK